jgi:hypothetical protein
MSSLIASHRMLPGELLAEHAGLFARCRHSLRQQLSKARAEGERAQQ